MTTTTRNLAAAVRRNLTVAERALAAGDVATAEAAKARVEKINAKIAAERSLARKAAASDRQANIDAAEAAVEDRRRHRQINGTV